MIGNNIWIGSKKFFILSSSPPVPDGAITFENETDFLTFEDDNDFIIFEI